MCNVVAENKKHLDRLCETYDVAILELFGSACKGGYAPGRSDLDFLVRFNPCSPEEHAERYFGLLAGLQDLFHCNVDLVEMNAIKNPFFLESIASSRATVYAD